MFTCNANFEHTLLSYRAYLTYRLFLFSIAVSNAGTGAADGGVSVLSGRARSPE